MLIAASVICSMQYLCLLLACVFRTLRVYHCYNDSSISLYVCVPKMVTAYVGSSTGGENILYTVSTKKQSQKIFRIILFRTDEIL